MMQLGCDGGEIYLCANTHPLTFLSEVFVGSGIFRVRFFSSCLSPAFMVIAHAYLLPQSANPAKRARAIVQAVSPSFPPVLCLLFSTSLTIRVNSNTGHTLQ